MPKPHSTIRPASGWTLALGLAVVVHTALFWLPKQLFPSFSPSPNNKAKTIAIQLLPPTESSSTAEEEQEATQEILPEAETKAPDPTPPETIKKDDKLTVPQDQEETPSKEPEPEKTEALVEKEHTPAEIQSQPLNNQPSTQPDILETDISPQLSSDPNKSSQPSMSLSDSLDFIASQDYSAPEEAGKFDTVVSPQLRKELAQAVLDQKAYLRGQTHDSEYPITRDPDGTRFVNINGICWQIPKAGSDEPWRMVVSGCAGQTKTFQFELDIAPEMLTPDSPFLMQFQ